MENLVIITKKLLKSINIRYTNKYIEDNILTHPNYPSLLAVSDTLNKYNVTNLAVKVSPTAIEKLTLPCIVQVKKEKPLFYLLTEVSKNEVVYFDGNNKIVRNSLENFHRIWTGICLLIEKTKSSGEEDIHNKLKKLKFSRFLMSTFIIFFVGWIANSICHDLALIGKNDYLSLIFIILKIIGLTLCLVLIRYEIDGFNPMLQNLCSGGGQKVNCDAVLNSKHSKLFDSNVSLGLIGFSYFFSTFFYLILNKLSISSLSIISIVSILTIPIIVFSIYYQAAVIKQWCIFCIGIQAVLILELSIAFLGRSYWKPINYIEILFLACLLLLPIVVWPKLKTLIENSKQNTILNRRLNRIKDDKEVFTQLLLKADKLSTPIQGLGISLIQEKSKYHILKVCNPHCSYCSTSHNVLEKILNSGIISLQIVFLTYTDDDVKVVEHFLAIDSLNKPDLMRKALHVWYSAKIKNFESFKTQFPVDGSILKKQRSKINDMNKLCQAENIKSTPTIFVNKSRMPSEYYSEDLIHVIY